VKDAYDGIADELAKGVVLALSGNAKLKDLDIAPQPIAEFRKDLKRAKFTNGDSVPFIKSFFSGVSRPRLSFGGL